jgi:hypothetical protein
MSDATSSPAQLLADHGQCPEPVRDGVLHMEELSLADDRTAAHRIMRRAGSVALDAHGAYVVSDDESATYALRHPELFSVKRPFDALGIRVSWPAPLVGADDLLLIFPPGGGEAGRD